MEGGEGRRRPTTVWIMTHLEHQPPPPPPPFHFPESPRHTNSESEPLDTRDEKMVAFLIRFTHKESQRDGALSSFCANRMCLTGKNQPEPRSALPVEALGKVSDDDVLTEPSDQSGGGGGGGINTISAGPLTLKQLLCTSGRNEVASGRWSGRQPGGSGKKKGRTWNFVASQIPPRT